jgi:hypothetical protein
MRLARPAPDCAEFIIGPAEGRTRWLHPGYGGPRFDRTIGLRAAPARMPHARPIPASRLRAASRGGARSAVESVLSKSRACAAPPTPVPPARCGRRGQRPGWRAGARCNSGRRGRRPCRHCGAPWMGGKGQASALYPIIGLFLYACQAVYRGSRRRRAAAQPELRDFVALAPGFAAPASLPTT